MSHSTLHGSSMSVWKKTARLCITNHKESLRKSKKIFRSDKLNLNFYKGTKFFFFGFLKVTNTDKCI